MAGEENDNSVDMVDPPLSDSLNASQSKEDLNRQNADKRITRVKVYPNTANGPFIVYFREIDRPLNVLNISDILYRTYKSVKEVKKVSLKKLRAVFSNRDHANAVIVDPTLTKSYRVYVPCDQVEISGVVYDALLDPHNDVEKHGKGHFKHENIPSVAVLDVVDW